MHENFALLKSRVDVYPLMKAVEREYDLFGQITARQDTPGSPHGDTKAIFLRWSKDLTVDAAFNDIEAVDFPAFFFIPEARDLVAEVVRLSGATKLGRVLITSLKPGGAILPHADEGAVADHYERFHVVLKSDEGNFFYSQISKTQGEYIRMRQGEIWWFNHKRPHWLENNSDSERIHLIVDAVAPKYRRERDAVSA